MLTPLLVGIAASIFTVVGGLIALRCRHRLVLVLGLAAGVVLGVAVFDLLPEAIELGVPTVGLRSLCIAMALGLAGYMLLDRGLHGAIRPGTGVRAHLAPATLTLHSFVDGLGIGLAFQAGSELGLVVAAAVLTHDLADGVNTVSLSLASGDERAARGWLYLNGAAPLTGVVAGLALNISSGALALRLAAFAGAFLYIGVGELLPRSQALDPRLRTTLANLCGIALIAIVTTFVH